MLSKPGGVSSAIIVCENAWYGAWNRPKTTLYAQNSQTLWNPSLSVHMPIMPHSGIMIVTTFVTTNIVFVGIFQYRWMYQKPSVLMVDVIA